MISVFVLGCLSGAAVVAVAHRDDESLGTSAPGPADLAKTYLFRGVDTANRKEAPSMAVEGDVHAPAALKKYTSMSAYADMGVFAEQIGVQLGSNYRAPVIATNSDLREKTQFVNDLQLGPDTVVILALAAQVQQFDAAFTRFRSDVIFRDGNTDDFFDRYGDQFVSEVQVGALYAAAYVCRNATMAEKDYIAARLQISAAIHMAEGTEGAEDGLRRVESEHHLNCFLKEKIFGRVSGDSGKVGPKPADDVAARAKKFASASLTAPILLELETSPYETVDGRKLEDVTTTVLANRAYETEANGIITKLNALRVQLIKIFYAYDWYKYPGGDGSLTRIWQAISQVHNATLDVQGWLDTFHERVSTTDEHPGTPYPILAMSWPTPCVTVAESTATAGNAPGSSIYTDVDELGPCGGNIGECVTNRFYLSEVLAKAGSNGQILGLQETWSSAKGSFSSSVHGINKGKKMEATVGSWAALPRRGKYGLDANGHLTCLELYYDSHEPVGFGNCLNSYTKEWFQSPESSPAHMVIGFRGFYDADRMHGSVTQAGLIYAHMHPFYWSDQCQLSSG